MMMDKKKEVLGVFAPMVTPFRDDRILFHGLIANVEKMNRPLSPDISSSGRTENTNLFPSRNDSQCSGRRQNAGRRTKS